MNSKKATTLFTWGTFLVLFSISVGHALQGSLLTDLIDYYSLKSAGQGSIGALQSFGSILGLFLPFLLIKKLKKPIMLFLLLLLEVAALFLIGIKPPFLLFILLYMLFGLAKGISDSVASSTLADLHSGRTLAKYMGIQHGVFGIGGLAMPLVISRLLAKGTAWNNIYTLTAVFIAFLCAFYFIVYRTTRPHLAKGASSTQPIKWRDVRLFFSKKRDAFLLAGIFTYSVSQIGYYLWISRYVEKQLFEPGWGQIALALFWIGTALSRIVVPQIKLPPMRVVLYGNIAAAIVAAGGILSMSPLAVAVCSFVTAFLNGATMPLQVYTGCSWHKDVTLLTTTLSFFLFYIGQVASPPIVGAITAATSMPVGMMISPVFMLLSALFAIPLLKEKI